MNFKYEERIQLVKTVRLSTHIVIFKEKTNFWKGSKKSIFFSFDIVKFAYNSYMRLKSTTIDLLMFFNYFWQKGPILGTLSPFKIILMCSAETYLIKTLYINTYMTIYGVSFFYQEGGKICRNSKILSLSSLSLNFALGLIFSFSD